MIFIVRFDTHLSTNGMQKSSISFQQLMYCHDAKKFPTIANNNLLPGKS